MAGAPRLLSRLWHGPARGALLAMCLWLAVPALAVVHSARAASAADVCTEGDGMVLRRACFLADPPPARRYGHDILGATPEWANLALDWGPGADPSYTKGAPSLVMRLDDGIFEDVAPRIVELDGDSLPEVMVVNSEHGRGARLFILDVNTDGVRAMTGPFIGQQNRWLAPLGATDLDGDGEVEIAWIDRPHLAKVLRIFKVQGSGLVQVGETSGLTNHRIGEADIAGGIRMCAGAPEMILATGNWSDLVAVRWTGTDFERTYLGIDTTRAAFDRTMACE